MDTNLPEVSEREGRLGEVLAAILEAQERGAAPEPAEWLARYPEFAAELSEFFASEDRFRSVAAPLRQAVGEQQGVSPTVLVRRRLSEEIPFAAGQRFGDYELLEEIGRGGMGVVYKARQKAPDRLVALKVVGTGRGATAVELQRFRNEADLAGQLDHPNIVPVYEVGERDGLLFFSMKLIEGGTLAGQLGTFASDPRA
jgi:serine/threonine-protein kinase